MGSLSWKAILAAHQAGAVIAGSSAGAMVLCEFYYDPGTQSIQQGLNLISGACVLPHHNTFGKSWAKQVARKYPEILFIGIDEETGMIDEGPQGQWRIYGKGSVTSISPATVPDLPQGGDLCLVLKKVFEKTLFKERIQVV